MGQGRQIVSNAIKDFIFALGQGTAASAQAPGGRGTRLGMAAALQAPQVLAEMNRQRAMEEEDRKFRIAQAVQQLKMGRIREGLAQIQALNGAPASQVIVRPAPYMAPEGLQEPPGERLVGTGHPEVDIGGVKVRPQSSQEKVMNKLRELRQAAEIEREGKPAEVAMPFAESAQGIYDRRTGRVVQPKPVTTPAAPAKSDFEGFVDSLLKAESQKVGRDLDASEAAVVWSRARQQWNPRQDRPTANNNELISAVMDNPQLYEQLTPSLKGAIAPALNARGFKGFGKALSESALNRISETRSAVAALRDLRGVLVANEQFLGPLTGLQAVNPYSEGRKAQADINRVRQRVGKALEGGVLRKEDEEKYKTMLSTLTDIPSTAIYKTDQMLEDLGRDLDTFITTQAQGGRNTSGVAPAVKPGSEPTAVNPKTGEKLVYRNGQWVKP